VPERISVVGVGCDGSALPARAAAAVAGADLVVGAPRHLDALGPPGARIVPLGADLSPVLDAVAGESGRVCVLATGDPGFFGIVRVLAARFGSAPLDVHPAVSSVATAFARIGLPWDDALVVSAHGRPLDDAVAVAVRAAKAAVLVSPENPPEAVGKALVAAGAQPRRVHVCSHLGTGAETVLETDLDGLAAGTWDPRSVVVLLEPAGTGVAAAPVLAFGLPEDRFEHRDGMVTKAEVRAVVLGKLALPARGVLWDVGAGSASVAVEAARLAPGVAVYAVEADAGEAARARRNAVSHGAALQVVAGRAPAALAGLPDPDRAFVGGGGVEVLDAVLARLRPGGRVVATFAAVDRAAEADSRLGNLVQVGVARGRRLPDGGLRLAAQNPVFVVWGPGGDAG
jgi:precorrin-6B C5,15-methyltransferase / cobalt-precorrin-6B C5,C15-methyltransferase